MESPLLLDNFELLAETVGSVAKLRVLVLQLAVMGKLVEQDATDKPACNLLQEIETKRTALIEDGEIRDAETDPTINPNALPFPIPENWTWCKLDRVMRKMGAGSTPLGGKKVYVDDGTVFLRSQNVWNGGLRLDDVARISESTHAAMRGTWVEPGDVLLNITGASIGRCAVVPDDFTPANVSQHVAILRLIDKRLRSFVHLCAISPFFQDTIMRVQVGVSREGLSMTRLREFPLPLPPLAEQRRIVVKVNQLLALCDELEARQQAQADLRSRLTRSAWSSVTTAAAPGDFATAWQRVAGEFDLLHATPESVADLRQAILQLAVIGRLVGQDERDEPAEKLLQRIAEQRAILEKSGDIDKAKPLEPVSPEQTPFELPYSWQWVRVAQLSRAVEYGTSHKGSTTPEGVPVFRMGNIQDGKVLLDNLKYVPESIDDLPGLFLRNHDLLFNRTNSADLVGKTGIFKGPSNAYTFASYLIRVTLFELVDSDFVNLAMNAPYYRRTQIEPEITQQCGQANLNGTKLKSSLLPLPPLAEQRRIVTKVTELLALCDRLEAGLAASQAAGEQLLASVVHGLLNGAA
jgi:type I restriction enzyme S subunit